MGKKKKAKKDKKRIEWHDYPIRICKHYRLDGSCDAWATVLCNQFKPGITPNGKLGYYCHMYMIVEPEAVEHKEEEEKSHE